VWIPVYNLCVDGPRVWTHDTQRTSGLCAKSPPLRTSNEKHVLYIFGNKNMLTSSVSFVVEREKERGEREERMAELYSPFEDDGQGAVPAAPTAASASANHNTAPSLPLPPPSSSSSHAAAPTTQVPLQFFFLFLFSFSFSAIFFLLYVSLLFSFFFHFQPLIFLAGRCGRRRWKPTMRCTMATTPCTPQICTPHMPLQLR
jgi:hypothetical protein